MPRLEVLVGMIASSKSTYARQRADEGAICIAHDDLTQMAHGGAYRYEQGLREMYREMEEMLATTAIAHGKDVVIDRTHLTRESRARWINFAAGGFGEEFGVKVVAVEFPREIAFAHACRRYAHDHRGRPFSDWLKVALHHEGQADAEPLADDEGFDEIIRKGVLDGA